MLKVMCNRLSRCPLYQHEYPLPLWVPTSTIAFLAMGLHTNLYRGSDITQGRQQITSQALDVLQVILHGVRQVHEIVQVYRIAFSPPEVHCETLLLPCGQRTEKEDAIGLWKRPSIGISNYQASICPSITMLPPTPPLTISYHPLKEVPCTHQAEAGEQFFGVPTEWWSGFGCYCSRACPPAHADCHGGPKFHWEGIHDAPAPAEGHSALHWTHLLAQNPREKEEVSV